MLVSLVIPSGWVNYIGASGCLIVITGLVATTLLRRDLWPFSDYPMFSAYRAPRAIRFFELLLLKSDGSSIPVPKSDLIKGEDFNSAFGAAWTDSASTSLGGFPMEVARRFATLALNRRSGFQEVLEIRVMVKLTIFPSDSCPVVTTNSIGGIMVRDLNI